MMANAMGGPDNITVVAARFDGERLGPPNDSDLIGHQVYDIPGRAPSDTGTVDDMMRARTEQMEALYEQTPVAIPATVRVERQEKGLVVKGVLAAAAVVLGVYLVWQLIPLF